MEAMGKMKGMRQIRGRIGVSEAKVARDLIAEKLKEARGDTNNISQLGWIGIVAVIIVVLLAIVNRVFPQIANGVFQQVATALGITLT